MSEVCEFKDIINETTGIDAWIVSNRSFYKDIIDFELSKSTYCVGLMFWYHMFFEIGIKMCTFVFLNSCVIVSDIVLSNKMVKIKYAF